MVYDGMLIEQWTEAMTPDGLLRVVITVVDNSVFCGHRSIVLRGKEAVALKLENRDYIETIMPFSAKAIADDDD